MIYFLRHAYCVGVAPALAALISLLTGGVRLELLPLFALLAYMVRMLDDHHDYDTDTKQKPLTKKTLLLLLIVFGAVYGALDLLFFGLRGLICLLPLACAVLQNRFEVLKLFFLTLVSAIYTATAFFSGESDDNGYYEYFPVIKAAYGEEVNTEALAGNESAFAKFRELCGQLPGPQINSVIVDARQDRDEATVGYRLMGQRFTIDADIMQRLVFREVEENEAGQRRMLPSGLDVPAALGSDTALKLLEENGDTSYKNYTENMNKMREKVEQSDASVWSSSIYSAWLNTLRPLLKDKGEGYPKFMQSEKWKKKNLVSFLGSYAELKHDSILYSKQVMAEMGDGGVPDKLDDRGYVEPEPDVFGRLAAMARATSDGLKNLGLISSENAEQMSILAELSDKLKVIAEKELSSELPTAEEFELIRTYGDQIKHLWLKTVEDGRNKGYYKSMNYPAAVVADIANDPNGSCLEVATGNPAHIYVAVYFDGSVHLTSGTVFTYYEFAQPSSQRLTDKEWRERFNWGKEYPREPEWVYDFTHFYEY